MCVCYTGHYSTEEVAASSGSRDQRVWVCVRACAHAYLGNEGCQCRARIVRPVHHQHTLPSQRGRSPPLHPRDVRQVRVRVLVIQLEAGRQHRQVVLGRRAGRRLLVRGVRVRRAEAQVVSQEARRSERTVGSCDNDRWAERFLYVSR